MELKIKLLSLCCLMGSLSFGQSVPSLTVAPDARSAAMGNVGTATTPDAYSIYWNTAKSVFATEQAALAYTYIPQLNKFSDDFRLHSLAGYYKINEKNAVMAGYRYFQNGKFLFNSQELKPVDYALELGYARLLGKGFSLGAAVRYLHSDLKVVSAEDAVVFDLGAYYNTQVNLWSTKSLLAVGLNFANFGTKIGEDEVPAVVRLGGALTVPCAMRHELSVAADLGYQILPEDIHDWDVALGAEYWYNHLVALRAGYHWGDVDNGNADYVSVGCGVCYYHVHADFSYLVAADSKAAVDKTWRLTLGVDLGIFKGKQK